MARHGVLPLPSALALLAVLCGCLVPCSQAYHHRRPAATFDAVSCSKTALLEMFGDDGLRSEASAPAGAAAEDDDPAAGAAGAPAGAAGAGEDEAAEEEKPKKEECCHDLTCAKCLACLADIGFYCYCKENRHVVGCELGKDGWPTGICPAPEEEEQTLLRKKKKCKGASGASGASGESGSSGASGASGSSGASGGASGESGDSGESGLGEPCCENLRDVRCLACRAGIPPREFCTTNGHVEGCDKLKR